MAVYDIAREFSFQNTLFQLFYFKGQRNGIAHRYRYLPPLPGETALNIEEFQKKRRKAAHIDVNPRAF
jgi:hypothetical protein